MKSKFGIFTVILILLSSIFHLPSSAQAQPQSPIYTGLQNAFDLHNTNALVTADEVNLTPLFKWNGDKQKAGGGVRVDWWVTDQQGAFLGFDEYSDRSSYFSLGYQARTVFKIVEFGLGFGTRQNNDAPFGDVNLFITPSASVRLAKFKDFDLRLKLGADLVSAGKPSPFVGITLTAFRF